MKTQRNWHWVRSPAWRVAGILLATKLLYWLLVCGFILAWGERFDEQASHMIRRGWFPPEAPPPEYGRWERHFATWDAKHYLYLATHGYAPEVRSIAFYPLWPILIRTCTPLLGGNPVWAGLVLANVFSLVAWFWFHRITARRYGEAAANGSLAFLLAFPGALFFQFIYTEALFFLLLMALWWGLERRRWTVATVAALLLPLTRGVGVFAVLPVGWHLLHSRGFRLWRKRQQAAAGTDSGCTPEEAGVTRALPVPWGLLVAPVAGWGVYLLLMWHWTGNPWSGIDAQKYWGVHSISNLWDVPKFIRGYFRVTTWHEFGGSLLDRLAFVLAVYAVPVLWRHGRDLLPWTIMLAVIPAMSGTFTSYVRFASCAFPVFVAFGVWVTVAGSVSGAPGADRPSSPWSAPAARPKMGLRGWLGWTMGAAFAGIHLHLLRRFLLYEWAG